ncbi:MAG TPA: beta-ketoacyl-ACP synthase II [Planctomycetota bacterium]|jgi:3-oxoacyl-[acyl-carrier-protein] synthase II|nr:beta-ketoacyl-ACP synthase II [Planctomycetota bacterium]
MDARRRRVVVTGLGAVTPLGREVPRFFERLLAGESGAVPITKFDAAAFTTRFACEVSDFNPDALFPKAEAKRLDPFAQYALHAAGEALRDSHLDLERTDRRRVGAIVGTGIGGIHELEDQHSVLTARGPGRVSPFLVPKMMANAVSGQIAIKHGLRGTNFTTASACASSGHAIGLALRAIQYGDADIVLTGGAEAATTPLSLAGFCAARALSTRNDDPRRASRPFDRGRDGFVMGEGGAILVLEELEAARARGARIYAEVLGFGSTDDAFHITAPAEDGDGAARAMAEALRDGGVAPEEIEYVNAHGTSTELNDKMETQAIKAIFGKHARALAISSTKSMIGHLLGAAAAVELLATVLSIQRGVVHPTINHETPDPDCDLDYVPNEARALRIRHAISNSFGFGGHNVTLLVGAPR